MNVQNVSKLVTKEVSKDWPKGATHRLIDEAGTERFGRPSAGVLCDVATGAALDETTWNVVGIDYSRHEMLLCSIEADGSLQRKTPEFAYIAVMNGIWGAHPTAAGYAKARNKALRDYAREKIFSPYDVGYFLGYYGVPMGEGADDCDPLAVHMGECPGIFIPDMFEPVCMVEMR